MVNFFFKNEKNININIIYIYYIYIFIKQSYCVSKYYNNYMSSKKRVSIKNKKEKPSNKSNFKKSSNISSEELSENDHPYYERKNYHITNSVERSIELNVQNRLDEPLQKLNTFLSSDLNFINNKNDPSTNIVDRITNKCYKITEGKIDEFFFHLDICRRKKTNMMFYEKQLDYSGIMIDFDMFQYKNKTQLQNNHFRLLCKKIYQLLHLILDMDEEERIIFGITKKRQLVYYEEEKKYKDGFHILIPEIPTN